MDAEVEARTVRGPRWFVVSGKSGQDAATVLRTLIERRDRWQFSYYVCNDDSIDGMAPIVERLAGR